MKAVRFCFSLLAGAIALSFAVGCASSSIGYSTNPASAAGMGNSSRDGKGIDLEPRAYVVPHLVTLRVDTVKVAGEASGFLANVASVKQSAIANALMMGQGDILKASDVLVGVNFGYEYGDTTIVGVRWSESDEAGTSKRVATVRVTVSGYPARYAKFRPMSVNDSTMADITGGAPIIDIPRAEPATRPITVPIGQP